MNMKQHPPVLLNRSSPLHAKPSLFYLCLLTPLPAVALENATWEHFADQSYITTLVLSSTGKTLWVGTPDGLEQRDAQTGELQRTLTQTEGLPANYVAVLDNDGQNGLWVGTGRGLVHYNSQGQWQVFTQDNSSLPANGITALFSDNPAGVWIGTNGGGLAHYQTSGQWQVFNTGNSDLPNNQVTALYRDNQGELWVGTFKGLARYSSQGQWQVFTSSNTDSLEYRVNAIDSDSQDTLWVGTGYYFFTFVGGGLTSYNAQGQWQEISSGPNTEWSTDWVNVLDPDPQGGLWVGTNGGGLAYYDAQGQWQLFNTDNSDLPNDGVTAIDSDSQNRLWIGTKGGLARLTFLQANTTSGNSSQVTIPTQLPTQSVAGTACDLKLSRTEQACNAHGQTLKDFEVLSGGYLSNAIITGTLTNHGWVSNLTVMAQGVVTGGVVTGYIKNAGLLKDFEFKGASLNGGTLGGTIRNTSQVGGYFQNVTLQPDTKLTGGRLKGTIQGDPKAPALLENLTIKAGSVVSGVKLGQGVKIERGAKVEEVKPEQPQPGTALPTLGSAKAVNAKGETLTVQTQIAGGAAVEDADFSPTLTAKSLTDTLEVKGQFQVDPAHVNQSVKIFVTATYQALAKDREEFQLKLTDTGGLMPWDGQLSSLSEDPFQPAVTLLASYEFSLYHGVLLATGVLKINFGYILADGTVVQSPEEITVTIE